MLLRAPWGWVPNKTEKTEQQIPSPSILKFVGTTVLDGMDIIRFGKSHNPSCRL